MSALHVRARCWKIARLSCHQMIFFSWLSISLLTSVISIHDDVLLLLLSTLNGEIYQVQSLWGRIIFPLYGNLQPTIYECSGSTRTDY